MLQTKGRNWGNAIALQWIALIAVFVCVAAFAFVRISPTDISWHLATARLVFSQQSPLTALVSLNRWPTVNTFSYTYPDHTLFQQYPIFQTLLYAVWRVASWEGLSLLHVLGWIAITAVWMIWGGGLARASRLHVLWLYAAFGMQQRMVLRPEMLTYIGLGLLLIQFDRYRLRWSRGKNAISVLAAIALLQWLMMLTHQFFVLGFALQIAFLIHLCVVRAARGRFGIASRDAEIPFRPFLLTLLASLTLACATPLGFATLSVPFATVGTVAHLGKGVMELASISGMPYVQTLVAIAGMLALGGWYAARKNWQPFDIACAVLGAALACVGWRGVGFFVLFSVAVFSRCMLSAGLPTNQRQMDLRGMLKFVLTMATAIFVLDVRWMQAASPSGLEATQAGIGRAHGQWPDAAIAYLNKFPPPGEVLNLSWYSGNYLIWGLYPQRRVFADPRFEAYPWEFLSDVIDAQDSQSKLAGLIERYQPGWFLGEVRLPGVIKRGHELVQSGAWSLAYYDSLVFVLVRRSPEGEWYLAETSQVRGLSSPLLRDSDVADQTIPAGVSDRSEQCARIRPFISEFSLDLPKECL